MFQADVIRRLANRYGKAIVLANPGETTTDLETGTVRRSYVTKTLRRALCLPGITTREQFNLTSRPSTFAYGGNFEVEDLRCIFTKSMVDNFEITKQTILKVDGKCFLTKEIISQTDSYFDMLFHRIDDIDLGRNVVRAQPITTGVRSV